MQRRCAFFLILSPFLLWGATAAAQAAPEGAHVAAMTAQPGCQRALLPALPELSPEQGAPAVQILLCDSNLSLRVTAQRDGRVLQEEPPVELALEDPVPQRPGLEIYRHAIDEMSHRARVVPVLFVHTPPLSLAQRQRLAQDEPLRLAHDRLWKSRGIAQWRRLKALISRHKKDKALLRDLVLRDGYLFLEDTATARAAFRVLRLEDLFDEEEIYLRRGDGVWRLRRDKQGYAYAEGRRAGGRARLLLYDRVATRREALLEGSLVWDLDRLRRAAGLRTFKLSQAPSRQELQATATLWSGEAVPAVAFWDKQGKLTLALLAPEGDKLALRQALLEARERMAIYRGILRAGEQMVDENLRFDEPKTEEGQQDGELRRAWSKAYFQGHNTYRFNGDSYRVFDQEGRPQVPQVCVDFIFDAAERWSGAWWSPREQPRQRTEGFLDFGELLVNRRQIWRMVQFARDRPEIMDLLDVQGRVPFHNRGGFYQKLRELAPQLQDADILVIFGLRDDERNHWHSFYVYRTDPMDGVPILLMGNAGTARVQVWYDVMRSAPRRYLRHRVRLRHDWVRARRRGEPMDDPEAPRAQE